jgi:hypothetical protein
MPPSNWILDIFKELWTFLVEIIKPAPTMSTPRPPLEPPSLITFAERVVETSNEYLGKDVTPNDEVSDDLACAQCVSRIIKDLLPDFPILVSTRDLFNHLSKDKRFKGTNVITPGTIIISPRTETVHGHCGIWMDKKNIASNNSKTGLWEKNYTLDEWVNIFRLKRGLKIYFFQPVSMV